MYHKFSYISKTLINTAKTHNEKPFSSTNYANQIVLDVKLSTGMLLLDRLYVTMRFLRDDFKTSRVLFNQNLVSS